MQFSDDQIIDYLLGEASAELRMQLEGALPEQPELVERLRHFRGVLGHIDSLHDVYEPPADLIDSTWQRIDESEQLAPNSASSRPPVHLSSDRKSGKSGSNSQKRIDSLVLTACLVLVCSLLLPAVAKVRYESRRLQCQGKLAEDGKGLVDFSLNDPDGRFPAVGLSGPTSFAGVYAVLLKSTGVEICFRDVSCPSLPPPDASTRCIDAIPTLHELMCMDDETVRLVQQVAGGNYAYSLGVIEDSRIVPRRCVGSSSFAILSDAPLFEADEERFVAHEGRGINVLYEDGHVEFINLAAILNCESAIDYPFRNYENERAVGLSSGDDCLAPSSHPPLGRRPEWIGNSGVFEP